jgi:Flp pilus assembly protein TadD
VSPDELAFRKASALAGLGRLEEAVQSVSQFGEADLMPQWMYCSRLGVVYMVAKRREEVIQLSRRAVELAPENATVLVDHGINTIVYRHDPVTARNLLAKARSHALSDTVQPFALWLDRASAH